MKSGQNLLEFSNGEKPDFEAILGIAKFHRHIFRPFPKDTKF